MRLRRIIYTSQATTHFSKRELLTILHDSRAFNTIDQITGVLMHKEGAFLQVIEGSTKNVEELFNRIQKDQRHTNIQIVQDTFTLNRLFSDWAMGCADFDDPKLSFIPGIRTDLNNPQAISDIVTKLPEVASFLIKNLAS